MKKFKFTMQSILDVRKSLREAREMELAEARAALARERERLELILRKIAEALSPEIVLNATEGYFLVQRERYLKKLRDTRLQQERRINEASTAVDVAMARLKEAITEMKKMERAKERQHEDWSIEFKRDEQKINDETASARAHMRILAGSFE
jgi:flagellar protein FliJ